MPQRLRPSEGARRPAKTAPAGAGSGPATPRLTLSAANGALLLAILGLAAALRCVRLGVPLGGFHSLNEAHYSLLAINFFHLSPLMPTPDGRYLFLETPPFYSYLLHGVFRLFGVSVLAGRLLSVLSSLALVTATCLLGALLFGAEAGLLAALVMAVSPVAVLAGRNIQTDSTLLFLLVAALFFYYRAGEDGAADRLRAGGLYGLALFTKLFAAVAVPAIAIWEMVTRKGFRWLGDRRRWAAAGLAAVLPALFYGYHAHRDFDHFRRDVFGGAAVATSLPRSAAEWAALGAEAFWAFSPVVSLLLLAGVAFSCRRPSRATLFLLLPLVSFGAFYLFAHKHSYYLLSLLPFAALLAARLGRGIAWRWLRVALIVALACTGSFFSAVDLCSMKLGFAEFAELGRAVADLRGAPHSLLVDRDMRDNYGPVLLFYDRSASLLAIEDVSVARDGRLQLPAAQTLLVYFVPPQAKPFEGGSLFYRQRYGLELFGFTVAEAHPNPHFFYQGRYLLKKSGRFFDFGFRPVVSYPALALVRVPPEAALYRTAQGVEIRHL